MIIIKARGRTPRFNEQTRAQYSDFQDTPTGPWLLVSFIRQAAQPTSPVAITLNAPQAP